MQKLINLCPHPVIVMDCDFNEVVLPAAENPCRIKWSNVQIGRFANIDLHRTKFEEVYNLPEPKPDVMFLVSHMVLNAIKRDDLCAPGEPIRNPDGTVRAAIGIRR